MDCGGTRRKRERCEDSSDAKRESGIDDLPDEILVSILSRLSLKEAERTSVLSRRWRYLWTFTSGSLEFDAWNTKKGTPMSRKGFREWVNHVLELHENDQIDSFIVRFQVLWAARFLDNWIICALKKQPRNFELNLSLEPIVRRGYEFFKLPELTKHGLQSAFGNLKSLELASVDITDEMIHYVAASCCMSLERLSICASYSTQSLKLIDPMPKLKFLSICQCLNIKSVDVSVASLVSFTYSGTAIALSIKQCSNLNELELGGGLSPSFLFGADKYLGDSIHLERLSFDLPYLFGEIPREIVSINLPHYQSLKHLEITAMSVIWRSLLFFTMLIKTCPLLEEFKIEVGYTLDPQMERAVLFPDVQAAEAPKFHHTNLKRVGFEGYIGCPSNNEFLIQLFKIAVSLQEMTIDTRNNDFLILAYDARRLKNIRRWIEQIPCTYAGSREEAKKMAEEMCSSLHLKKPQVIIS
ncbi:F-box/LRR-repeat protein At3g59190-like [Andrographis paniculata]|uniref:F-box/LRR-repeat protein At3g59190-like n=1 Tax=Andrographis paniculata TaxID=175694 RepID=UPI0021E8B00F|nr:F-box/LRR-repeat protein At3g59190-like [Andrographis paniculata]